MHKKRLIQQKTMISSHMLTHRMDTGLDISQVGWHLRVLQGNTEGKVFDITLDILNMLVGSLRFF